MRQLNYIFILIAMFSCSGNENKKTTNQPPIKKEYTDSASLNSGIKEPTYVVTTIDTTSDPKANRLIRLYFKIQITSGSSEKAIFENQFFKEFPSDFESYRNLYGYIDGEPMPLYDKMEHVMLFYKLTSIDKKILYNKYFDIAENGIWEADNIQDFVIGERLKTDTKEICDILSKRTDDEIKNILHFVYDGPHPDDPGAMEHYQQGLDSVQNIDKRIAGLMGVTYEDLLREMDGHGH